MTSPRDLPPWLRPPAARPASRGRGGRLGTAAALAVALFAAGGGVGYLLGLRRAPHPAALPPPPVCPPALACAEPPSPAREASPRPVPAPARRSKTARAAPAALVPLPDRPALDENQRTQALRAFAAKRAPELRDCLDDANHGPPVELGAAFEINANGAVELVQILGAGNAPREVRRCYASRLKKWRFPEELLRGEEKLLVNFVL